MQTSHQIADRDALILDWQAKKAAATKATAEEYTARLLLVQLFSSPIEGTNNLELGSGYILKFKNSYNYNLSNSERPKPDSGFEPLATDAALDRIDKMGNEGKFISERLVKWNPELSLSEYRKLSDDMRKHIDKALKITPAAPAFELITPNA